MLPSCGHFRNIPCPFYKLALCVRPHCPYKHQNTDNGHGRQVLPQLVDEAESIFDSKLNLPSACASPSAVQEHVTYIPTPVESKPAGILKTSSSIIEKPSSVPVYKPTPISRLKECGGTTVIKKSNKSEYEPDFPITIRKKKNVEEYDPTEVKCIPKKSVTFIDPSSSADSGVPVILISSEDELDDSESTPKFSDDDLEEENKGFGSWRSTPEIKKLAETDKAAKEDIEIVEIDEFSVVDKILVDSKKSHLFLKAKQNPKLLNKINESSVKIKSVEKQNKSKLALTDNTGLKSKKEADSGKLQRSDSNTEEKTKKKSVDSQTSKEKNGQSKSDLKLKKDFNLSKVKKSDSDKKDIKKEIIVKDSSKNKTISTKKEKNTTSKGGKSERNDKLTDKEKYRTQSTLKKDKSNKESKEYNVKLKPSSKHSNESKRTPSVDKISKTDNPTTLHSLGKSTLKKRLNEEHSSTKLSNCINEPSLKKSKNFEGLLMSSEAAVSKTKNKMSNKHSSTNKRKLDGSDQDHPDTIHKSLSLVKKKLKADHKALKYCEVSSDSGEDFVNSCDIGSDLSDSDPDEECRRIFNECYPETSSHEKQKEAAQQQNSSCSSDIVILRKKRLAHPAAVDLKKRVGGTPKPDMKRPPNPAQVMFNRFAQVQSKFSKSNGSQNTANDSTSKGSDKKKLNFVPNHSLLAAVKSKNEDNSRFSPFLPASVSTSLKVSQRVAHVPEAALKPRPIIPADFGSKVPSNVRQKYLNAFIDECLKFMPTEDEAYDQAIEEEKKAYDRSSSKALYMNVAANTLQRLRNQAKESSKKAESASLQNAPKKTVSHETVLNGPLAQRRSFSIGPKKKAFDIKDLGRAELYEHLLQYVLTLEQLKENGFPQPHPTEKDRAVIEGIYANRTSYCNDAFKRVCCRCQKTYYVNVDGDYVRDEECDFHWGRIWKKKIAGTLESRYSCCQGDAESDGCCVSPGHVFEGSESHALKGFVKTQRKSQLEDNCYGIYALDCEMCYTTAGMELTRITVIDTDLKPVYESFVKPQHRVLDFNTRFSGITEDDLKNVRTSIHDVQAVLLCIFNDRTILIGHSLESDFKALKIFHRTVVDTSVVFPHKNGLPFKRALRTLTAEKLNKIIQNDIGGHDSHEDAAACMELMLWKIKEDLKGNR